MDKPMTDTPKKEPNEVFDNLTMYVDDDSKAVAVPLDLSVRKKVEASPVKQPIHDDDTDVKFKVLDLSEKQLSVSSVQPSDTARRSSVFPTDLAAVPAPHVYRAPDLSPLVADHASPDDCNTVPATPDASAASFRPYKPLIFPAFVDPQIPVIPPLPPLLGSLPPLPPLLPPLSVLTTAGPLQCPIHPDVKPSSMQYHHHLQQQQRQLQQHQQQLQFQQEHQFQLQQQQHIHFHLQQIQRQQQQLATYTSGGVGAFQIGTPLQYASDSPTSSASDSNHFQFNCSVPRSYYFE